MILDHGVAPTLVELLKSEFTQVLTPALKTVGNIVSGDDRQTDEIVELRVLPVISALLSHEEKDIKKEACWTLSNILCGTQNCVEAVIECDGLIRRLIKVLKSADFDVKKEACLAVANYTCNGTHIQVLQIAMGHSPLV